MDQKYAPPPTWIKDLPSLSHFRAAGKEKLPFAFEDSTPQTDAVLHFIIARVLARAGERGYIRKTKKSIKDKVVGEHNSGPWFQVVADVLHKDCPGLSSSDRVIAEKILGLPGTPRAGTARDAAEKVVQTLELNGRNEIIAKQCDADRFGARVCESECSHLVTAPPEPATLA